MKDPLDLALARASVASLKDMCTAAGVSHAGIYDKLELTRLARTALSSGRASRDSNNGETPLARMTPRESRESREPLIGDEGDGESHGGASRRHCAVRGEYLGAAGLLLAGALLLGSLAFSDEDTLAAVGGVATALFAVSPPPPLPSPLSLLPRLPPPL